MMCYLVLPRDWIFGKGCRFLFFAKIWVKILMKIAVKT